MPRTSSIHIFKPFIEQQLQIMLVNTLLHLNMYASPVLGQAACLFLDVIQMKAPISAELNLNCKTAQYLCSVPVYFTQGLSSTKGQYEWTKSPMSPAAYSYWPIQQLQVVVRRCESKQILQVVLCLCSMYLWSFQSFISSQRHCNILDLPSQLGINCL